MACAAVAGANRPLAAPARPHRRHDCPDPVSTMCAIGWKRPSRLRPAHRGPPRRRDVGNAAALDAAERSARHPSAGLGRNSGNVAACRCLAGASALRHMKHPVNGSAAKCRKSRKTNYRQTVGRRRARARLVKPRSASCRSGISTIFIPASTIRRSSAISTASMPNASPSRTAYKGKLADMAGGAAAAPRSPRRCGATRRSTI